MIIPNIFATNTSEELAAAPFNHCSSVCKHRDGVMIAWYAGSGECRDDQSVYVLFIDKRGRSHVLHIGERTGNPVLWQYGEHVILLYSRFETPESNRLVERWRHCSLWLQKLIIDPATRQVARVGEPKQLTDAESSLLGRCTPITSGGDMLLPLYNETWHYGVIMRGDGWQFEREENNIGECGAGAIQPTLWEESDGLHALCRNIGGSSHLAKHYKSDGGAWQHQPLVPILNRNNSLQVLKDGNRRLLIWNDSRRGRDNLTIGLLDEGPRATILEVLGHRYGSYPSLCYDAAGQLHITYTSEQHTIRHHVWTGKYLRRLEARARRGDLAKPRAGS